MTTAVTSTATQGKTTAEHQRPTALQPPTAIPHETAVGGLPAAVASTLLHLPLLQRRPQRHDSNHTMDKHGVASEMHDIAGIPQDVETPACRERGAYPVESGIPFASAMRPYSVSSLTQNSAVFVLNLLLRPEASVVWPIGDRWSRPDSRTALRSGSARTPGTARNSPGGTRDA